jgi:hypothetical protein
LDMWLWTTIWSECRCSWGNCLTFRFSWTPVELTRIAIALFCDHHSERFHKWVTKYGSHGFCVSMHGGKRNIPSIRAVEDFCEVSNGTPKFSRRVEFQNTLP